MMIRALLVAGLCAGLAGPVSAQVSSPYCEHLLGRIQAMRTSLNGLQNLVYSQSFTLLQCNVGASPSDDQLYGCLDNPGAQGVWRDAETRTVYVVVSKDMVRNLAAQQGLGTAALQRSFAMGETVRSKIAYGGVIDSLEAEIGRWEASYAEECGSAGGDDWSPSDGLLGVVPQPIP